MKKYFFVVLMTISALSVPTVSYCERNWKGHICPDWDLSYNWEEKTVPSYIDMVKIGEGEYFGPKINYEKAYARQVFILKGGKLIIESSVLVIGK